MSKLQTLSIALQNPDQQKRTIVKSLKLEKMLNLYNAFDAQKKTIFKKFEDVWGTEMAGHLLGKYDNAEALIWAFDARNLELFIEKF